MAQASSSEIAHATTKGTHTELPNGDIQSVSRHPASPDHEIVVISRPMPDGSRRVINATVHHKPLNEILLRSRQAEAKAKERTDRSKANQAAQLARKRARSAAASNKQD